MNVAPQAQPVAKRLERWPVWSIADNFQRKAGMAIDNDPQALKDAKADFQERMKNQKYTTRIPKGQKAPKAIR